MTFSTFLSISTQANNYERLAALRIHLINKFITPCIRGYFSGIQITGRVYAFKFGYDPDNMVTPIVTTACDLLGIVSLLAMLALLGVG